MSDSEAPSASDAMEIRDETRVVRASLMLLTFLLNLELDDSVTALTLPHKSTEYSPDTDHGDDHAE